MVIDQSKRWPLIALTLVLAALAFIASGTGQGFVVGSAAAWVVLMLIPGAILCLFIDKTPNLLTWVLYALVGSPVLVGAIGTLLLLAGLSPGVAAYLIMLFIAASSVSFFLSNRKLTLSTPLTGRQTAWLSFVIILFCAITGYLPFTREWWQVRSDAWFHGAVIAEIDAFGLPPKDPYFTGLALQYMWIYHVLILMIAKATAIRPFLVMPILNLQALAAFIIGTYLFATRFRDRFEFGMSSVLMGVLAMNALFWLFFPVVLIRAFTGEVTGMEEVRRLFRLTPFDFTTVRGLLRIYHNQLYFLDKFMVSTAFSIGLAFIAAFWYGVTAFLSDRRSLPLVLASLAMLGMLMYHPLVGFIMLVGLFGGLFLLHLWRSRVEGYTLSTSLMLCGMMLLCLLLVSPYLYTTMFLKETEQVLPFGVSIKKTIGIFISCALVIFLGAFQIRKMVARRDAPSLFFWFATLSITMFCLIIRLPGPNTFDKLPFFIFYPLAVAGGWSLIEFSGRWKDPLRRRIVTGLLFAVLLLPVNIIATGGYYNTPSEVVVTPLEMEVSEWVGDNTPRDAVFFDSNDRVFLLVTGPRRYYWGIESYAMNWGYRDAEMAKRRNARNALYATSPLDAATLETLGTINAEVYVIVREGEPGISGMEKFKRYPEIFHEVFSSGSIRVLRIDKAACLAAR
jgi:hypothetical protein